MMGFFNGLPQWLAGQGLPPAWAAAATTAAGGVVLLALMWLANAVTKQVILRVVRMVVRRTHFKWDDALLEAGVFTRLSHLAPLVVIYAWADDLLGHSRGVMAAVNIAVSLYLIFICVAVFFALLDAVQRAARQGEGQEKVSVKGFVQAVKLLAALVGLILALGAVLDKSPVYLLSGLGALAAVLMLVFRDAILGFTAGIMLSSNDMVRMGDWIAMPQANADGFVIDVSLTTVKIQNWDKTITTVPAYALISGSVTNYRGMFDSGGRRIKRSLYIDMQSVRFADPDLVARWRKMDLLKDYLQQKEDEIAAHNQERGTDLSILGNGRRVTNLGTFRAYVEAYLRANPKIHQKMWIIVRQLAPTEHGLPLELYTFSQDTRWAYYEVVQSDIFDHLLAVIGEFDLRVYQQPSGGDLQALLGGIKPAFKGPVPD